MIGQPVRHWEAIKTRSKQLKIFAKTKKLKRRRKIVSGWKKLDMKNLKNLKNNVCDCFVRIGFLQTMVVFMYFSDSHVCADQGERYNNLISYSCRVKVGRRYRVKTRRN